PTEADASYSLPLLAGAPHPHPVGERKNRPIPRFVVRTWLSASFIPSDGWHRGRCCCCYGNIHKTTRGHVSRDPVETSPSCRIRAGTHPHHAGRDASADATALRPLPRGLPDTRSRLVMGRAGDHRKSSAAFAAPQ